MNLFRKKPVVIEARQWNGSVDDALDIVTWTRGAAAWIQGGEVVDPYIAINTLEGMMTARPSDWIIRGVQGEFYPCKPDIFAATYDEVQHGVDG